MAGHNFFSQPYQYRERAFFVWTSHSYSVGTVNYTVIFDFRPGYLASLHPTRSMADLYNNKELYKIKCSAINPSDLDFLLGKKLCSYEETWVATVE